MRSLFGNLHTPSSLSPLTGLPPGRPARGSGVFWFLVCVLGGALQAASLAWPWPAWAPPGVVAGAPSGWLQIDLGAGNAQIVARYDITSANDVPNRDPKNWQVQGSHDGVNWTTLDTRTNEVFATRFLTKQYPFTNNTAYRYYKLNILSNFSGNANEGIQLAEWTLISGDSDMQPPPPDALPPAAPVGLTATAGAQVAAMAAASGSTWISSARST